MTTTTDDGKRILELLAEGKITVDEADQLLRALGATRGAGQPPAGAERDAKGPTAPRWVRITIDKAAREGRPAKQVKIRVPMTFLRSGVRLGAMFPRMMNDAAFQRMREQGVDFDFSKIDLAQLDAALRDTGEMTIDSDKAHIRIAYE
jgi:hypothetical protein